ncbi:hypothetical protein C7M84_022883 [Penaeus vannamei]|uniref:Uncharacterized protein n=1 Tax=Penaeus vannamei TaxID=6689 RepID=A0A423U5G4_PENVA|nr:hypothetical protein C7M84_022883 [Penaeus vannamei]
MFPPQDNFSCLSIVVKSYLAAIMNKVECVVMILSIASRSWCLPPTINSTEEVLPTSSEITLFCEGTAPLLWSYSEHGVQRECLSCGSVKKPESNLLREADTENYTTASTDK